MWVSLRKLELIPGFHFYITEINSKHQSSFLLSLKVVLMLLLDILNRLKSFRWYFLMFANNWIYWEVELLQHFNMKRNYRFYWYVKSFHLSIYWQVFVSYFNPTMLQNYSWRQAFLSSFKEIMRLSSLHKLSGKWEWMRLIVTMQFE